MYLKCILCRYSNNFIRLCDRKLFKYLILVFFAVIKIKIINLHFCINVFYKFVLRYILIHILLKYMLLKIKVKDIT